MGGLAKADVVAFTSENGVSAFFDALARAGKDARAFGEARVASIGTATADALARRGIVADVVPPAFHGEALAEAILADLTDRRGGARGARVVIPRALVAREALPERLRAAGADVDVVPVYETRPAGERARDDLRTKLAAGDIDVVLATSPSTIDNLCDLIGADARELLSRTLVASIGEVTADAVKRRGLVPGVVAAQSTLGGLVGALEAHFAQVGGAVTRTSRAPG
jgi:uroporphyrinogen III methyltransferase/synthase